MSYFDHEENADPQVEKAQQLLAKIMALYLDRRVSTDQIEGFIDKFQLTTTTESKADAARDFAVESHLK